MKELVKLVQEWSIARGLDKADSRGQFLKVVEEVGEVAAALARSDMNNLKEEIGDVVVTLIIYAQQEGVKINIMEESGDLCCYISKSNTWQLSRILESIYPLTFLNGANTIKNINACLSYLCILSEKHNLTVKECLQAAYTKISGRTGEMVGGIFVKREDIKTPYDPNVWPKNKKESEGGGVVDGDSHKQIELLDK